MEARDSAAFDESLRALIGAEIMIYSRITSSQELDRHTYDALAARARGGGDAAPVKGVHGVAPPPVGGIPPVVVLHPGMRAFIYASSTPYAVFAEREGHFQIPDVPPGSYMVWVWSIDPELRMERGIE